SLGLNSNWDMLFIVIALHYIDLCKSLTQEELSIALNSKSFSEQTLQFLDDHISDIELNLNYHFHF
ncbi:HAD family hydrolase, partial [Staphylococcus aureus]|nr:HAD family hydrolase [Staphylococcus aureus]